jgi:2-keto-3-deoxy-L-rhamnonate aldolase RhmA
MEGREFKEALHSGKSVYGTLITSPSPRLFDLICSLGLDFVFLCNEHIFYNPEILGWMCRAFRAAGINPVVRIPEPNPFIATQTLDSGAGAIVVPYVEDIKDVLDLVGAVKYRPLKGKKLQRILHGEEKLSGEMAEYIKKHNRNNTLILNIESPEGIKNMDQFLSVRSVDGPGVDGILLGPHDLSVSAEMPEKYDSEEFIILSCDVIRKARSNGVAAGGHTGFRGSLELQSAWVKAGANIILHSSDMFLFGDKLLEDMNKLRKLKDEKIITRESSDNV